MCQKSKSIPVHASTTSKEGTSWSTPILLPQLAKTGELGEIFKLNDETHFVPWCNNIQWICVWFVWCSIAEDGGVRSPEGSRWSNEELPRHAGPSQRVRAKSLFICPAMNSITFLVSASELLTWGRETISWCARKRLCAQCSYGYYVAFPYPASRSTHCSHWAE